MFLPRTNSGFTLIELLVTLVILGLTAALVAPNLFSWLRSREAAAQRNQLEQAFALQPLIASRSGKNVVVMNAQDLGIEGAEISVSQPILIQANGYCHGGAITLTLGDVGYNYSVTAPFCQLSLIPANEES